MIHQLATPHKALQYESLQVFQSIKEDFHTKCYEEPLASFIEVGYFGCFDATTVMHDRVG